MRHWIPELKDVPTNLVHEPWKMSKDQQHQFSCRLGVDYPNPIVKPTAPSPYSNSNNDKRGSKQNKGKNKSGHNPNRGKGQRYDMKSLKTGDYNFK